MRHRFKVIYFLPLAWSSAVAAQDLPDEIPDSLSNASSIASAAQSLGEAGAEKLLIKDLIGKTLTGADGNTVGRVENFVVIPGGRIVAALVSTGEGSTIAVPYAAIKMADAAEAANLTAQIPASELSGMSELKSLAEAFTN